MSNSHDRKEDHITEAMLDEAREEGYSDGYEAGREDGYDAGLEEDPEFEAAILVDEFRLAGFDPLESIEVRWDAALRALVCTQDGREVVFR